MSQQNAGRSASKRACPDCASGFEFQTLREFFNRRDFVRTAGAAAVTAIAGGVIGLPGVVARAADGTVIDPQDSAQCRRHVHRWLRQRQASSRDASETTVRFAPARAAERRRLRLGLCRSAARSVRHAGQQ